jgi:hypothetical protein
MIAPVVLLLLTHGSPWEHRRAIVRARKSMAPGFTGIAAFHTLRLSGIDDQRRKPRYSMNMQ